MLERDTLTLNLVDDALQACPDCPAARRLRSVWSELTLHRVRLIRLRSTLRRSTSSPARRSRRPR